MSQPAYTNNATEAWYHILKLIMERGEQAYPKNPAGGTIEVLHNSVAFPINDPVIVCPPRKVSYKFAAAEALWILTGDDTVAGIAPFNANISKFSDDGYTFFGAYGPKIHSQLTYVVKSLIADRHTRQAVVSIWRENPPKTKDIPCTVTLTFNIRRSKLNCHVFMRSSDSWLGVPYDFFNFAMIATKVAALYNFYTKDTPDVPVQLGRLYWTGVSSHIYTRNLEGVSECIQYLDQEGRAGGNKIPELLIHPEKGPGLLEMSLMDCRHQRESDSTPWVIRPQK